ncbi:hypothetical protein CC1G_07898 [Coprinopsis cinerea okayama7|uniref:Uncharacterized protein n=1 Tax=Coprinopsis cinerea (strain Okayama-7 / 130 / ATCC MYA-4618 / FGSC 9003) TaxID=240176 RepID=A8P6L9_COPC7|nr:hypothetical protein CC1G_07898 [Coprinopsis cinerea okayama7\|eukprot:XP_001839183.2 hypothetical protein CC1G_07898 [Coprinopsis cinerea okayama7\
MPEGSPARSPPPSSNADWRSSTHARGDAPADSMLFRTEVDAHDPFDESTLPTPIAREHPTHAQLNEEDRDRSTSDLSSLVTSPPLPALPSVTQSQPGVSSRSVTPVQQSPPTPPRAVRYSPAELAKALPSPPTAPPAGSSTSTSEYATPVAPTPPVTISFPSPRVGRFDVGEAGSVPSSVNSARTIVLADRSVDGEEQTSTSPPLPPLPSTPPATAGSSSLASRIATTPPPLASLRSEPSSFASRSSQLGSYGQGPSPLPSLPSSPSIPSLSQIYAPQDPKLDYEHNVVLLSPPSSRSESPFSVVSSVDGVGSPFVGFGALGLGNEGQGTSSTEAGARGMASPNAVFSVPASPSTPGSTTSNYISLPASNPGSPRLGGQPALTTSISPPNATIAESVYFDASYPHVASSTSPLVSSQSTEPTSPPSSNPFADPVTETSTTLPRPQSRSRSHSPALSSTPSTPRTALSAMESSLSDFESDLDNDVEREFTTLRSSTTIPARETSGSDVSPFASPRQPRPIANTSKNTTTTVQRRHQHDLEDDSGMISETDSLSSWASVGAGSGSN